MSIRPMNTNATAPATGTRNASSTMVCPKTGNCVSHWPIESTVPSNASYTAVHLTRRSGITRYPAVTPAPANPLRSSRGLMSLSRPRNSR